MVIWEDRPRIGRLIADLTEACKMGYTGRSRSGTAVDRGEADPRIPEPPSPDHQCLAAKPRDPPLRVVFDAGTLISPAGTRILYRRIPNGERFDNNRHGMQGELVMMNSDGTGALVLGRTVSFPGPRGRRMDGSWPAFPRGIDLYDIATKTVVAHLDRKGTFQQMIWSPDGKWLTGVANSFDTGWTVVRMEVATGAINPVSKVDCCTPDWFPDSSTMIFSEPPHDWTQLWMAGRRRGNSVGSFSRRMVGTFTVAGFRRMETQ